MSEQHRTPELANGSVDGFSCELKGRDFAGAITRVAEAWKAEGFGVPIDIDVQAEPDIDMPLRCNVVVREKVDRRLVVGFMDPMAVLQMTKSPEMAKVAQEVHERLQRVRTSLLSATADAKG